jgi:branched-chain amino acid aminotransferase
VSLAFHNGRFVPYSELAIAPHDAGFVFGATVTDFCRTYVHTLFRWPDHLARLRRDCGACAVPLPYSDDQLTSAAETLVAENTKQLPPDDDLALITFATPGPLGYMAGTASGPPTVAMHTFPLPKERYRRFFTDGVVLEETGMWLPTDCYPTPDLKHRSRIHWWTAGQMATAGGVAVLVSDRLAPDTAVGAVLAVRDGAIERPTPGAVLDSVSVKVVAELAAKVGIEVRTREHWPENPSEDGISEMLLAGSAFGIAGVKTYLHSEGDCVFDWPGPVFTKLAAAWSDLVGIDIVKQFTG